MDGRIVQLSRQVEEFLQASVELLESSEHEDTLASRQGVSQSPNRKPHEHLMLSHRGANGACERLMLDIQQAEITLQRLRAQGWGCPSGSSLPGAVPGKAYSDAGAVMPADRIVALEQYQSEVRACFLKE